MRQPYPFWIALRYLRTRGRRSFISFISLVSMVGIAVAVAVLITTMSVINGFEAELERRILGVSADAAVYGFEAPLQAWEQVSAEAVAQPGIRAAAPFVEGTGMVGGANGLVGVSVRGIQPNLERSVSNIAERMVSGTVGTLESDAWNVVIGVSLASELGLELGDELVLVLPEVRVTLAGLTPRRRAFTVTGIFEVGMREYDRGLLLVGFDKAAILFRTGGEATGVGFDLENIYDAPLVAGRFAQDLVDRTGGRVYVGDWTQQHANVFRSIQLTKPILFIMLSLVVAVAAFNIVSTLFMVVREKRGDIAILRSCGATPGSILSLFTTQGAAIGAVGTVAGLGLGALLVLNLGGLVGFIESVFGLDLLSSEAYLIGDLVTEVRPGEVFRICALSALLAVAATLYPAITAARQPPAEALRYE